MAYGIVQWWLKSKGYSSADFRIEDTLNKTKDESVDLLYGRIMRDAQNAAPTNKLSTALGDLATRNRNFRREHLNDVEVTIDSDVQEAFKDRVRIEVDVQLGGIDIDSGQKSRIRSSILGDFESIKIKDIPSIVIVEATDIVRAEVVAPALLGEASQDVLGRSISESEWADLRVQAFVDKDRTARSQYLKISNRMRTL